MFNYDIEIEVLRYLAGEFRDIKKCLQRIEGGESYFSRTDIDTLKKCSLDRGMGVVMFAQNLGANFNILNKYYEDFKKQIREL